MHTQSPEQQVLLLRDIQVSGAHLHVHNAHLIPAQEARAGVSETYEF